MQAWPHGKASRLCVQLWKREGDYGCTALKEGTRTEWDGVLILRHKIKHCCRYKNVFPSTRRREYGGVGGGESQGNVALQERGHSQQLLKSLDGYRSMKRKLKLAQEENVKMHATMDEMREKIMRSLERVGSFKERLSLSSGSKPQIDVQEEILALESIFECFQMMVTKYDKKQGECIQPKGEINACKPSVLA
ncbi:UNVERIFIED_CONTAM: hypothetical protein Scaly_2331700 [Sesamum calycinum]|uniref:Uncharacterized protein n=1 Tax=Sesamum calycinum TaxID=2727403 RepID=A0AAW2MFT7_9LAMI